VLPVVWLVVMGGRREVLGEKLVCWSLSLADVKGGGINEEREKRCWK